MQLPEERAARVGVILMGASLALWVALPVVPFLPLETGEKAALAGGQVIVAEVIFWLGAAIAGPEAARRIRSRWFRKPDPAPEPPQPGGGGDE